MLARRIRYTDTGHGGLTVAPTAADDVVFNIDHPLAGNVVALWVSRGGPPQDMLGTNGNMVQANSGVAEIGLGGLAFGNLGATNRAAYIGHSTQWKPTSQITIAVLCAAPPAGASGTYLFGTEAGGTGYGSYFFNSTAPHMYLRIGGAWADQGISIPSGLSRTPAFVGMTYNGATFTARWDQYTATQSITGSIDNSTASFDLGGSGDGYGGGSAAIFHQILILNRALSDGEWNALRIEPYQLLTQPKRQRVAVVTGYTMAAGQGSFALSGQTVALKAGRLLSAASGSYTLTGQDVALKADRRLAVDYAALALNGQPVTFYRGRVPLTAEAGTFALAGQNVGLRAGRLLSAGQGSFALSGQDVAFSRGRLPLIAGTGSFTITGQNVGLKAGRLLTATTALYSYSGRDIAFTYSGGGAAPISVGGTRRHSKGFRRIRLPVEEPAIAYEASSLPPEMKAVAKKAWRDDDDEWILLA